MLLGLVMDREKKQRKLRILAFFFSSFIYANQNSIWGGERAFIELIHYIDNPKATDIIMPMATDFGTFKREITKMIAATTIPKPPPIFILFILLLLLPLENAFLSS